MVLSWFLPKRSSSSETNLRADQIILRVEGGLLMTFGPEGDPLPPNLVETICAADDGDTLRMETGQDVDQGRVLAILDAQRQGPLSKDRNSAWIKAMLGLDGSFEATPSDLLNAEPAGPTPIIEGDGDHPGTEWLTPLTFDEAESSSMADADAVLVHGLRDGMSLSAGRFDPMLNGWVVRPYQLPSLAVQRIDEAEGTVVIDVTAVSTEGKGNRWSVASRQIELA